ncbi:MAG: hypothetical protein CUN53_16305, partial [Phototrophicales bacterium]
LHYLAEAAGLVVVQAGVLKPTVQAWRWLDLPPDERWQRLGHALAADLKARDRLWERYRLPSVDVQTWQTLVDHLQQLTPGFVYTRENFIRVVQPHLPTMNDLSALIPPLLEGPLTWLGIVSVQDEGFTLLPQSFSEPQNAELVQHEDMIYISLPDSPRLRPLIICCEWAEVKDNRLYINAAAIRRALENGSDALKMGSTLSELIGEPLPAAVFEQIQLWARVAQALTLRQITLFTAQDSDTLTDIRSDIRSDWRLRPLMGEPLSPHHVAVPSGRAEDLLRPADETGTARLSCDQPSSTARVTRWQHTFTRNGRIPVAGSACVSEIGCAHGTG